MTDLDVARRAIAAGMRWMQGMRTTTGLIVIAAGDHSARVCDADDCVLDIVETAHLLPDVNDPATKGCLLEQVRKRWGDAGATTCFNETLGAGAKIEWACIVERGTSVFYGPTEAAALVAALEAPKE